MDNEINDNIELEVRPKFNFIYELFMPTGKKIKNTIFILLVMILLIVLLIFSGDSFGINNVKVNQSLTLVNLLKVISYIVTVLIALKLVFHIVFQTLQYKNISYKFYKEYLVYEDSFLNQHKKKIQYQNVKEVEIRRSIWDRILGYGIIVIYTNAENEYSNGLVIYSIKTPKVYYDKIDSLIHAVKSESIVSEKIDEKINEKTVEEEKIEQDFKDSLKNINK